MGLIRVCPGLYTAALSGHNRVNTNIVKGSLSLSLSLSITSFQVCTELSIHRGEYLKKIMINVTHTHTH